MTWKELKDAIEKAGTKPDTRVESIYVDCGTERLADLEITYDDEEDCITVE